jgi:hypothetical protein
MQRVGNIEHIGKREQRAIVFDERFERRAFAGFIERGDDARRKRRACADVRR